MVVVDQDSAFAMYIAIYITILLPLSSGIGEASHDEGILGAGFFDPIHVSL